MKLSFTVFKLSLWKEYKKWTNLRKMFKAGSEMEKIVTSSNMTTETVKSLINFS